MSISSSPPNESVGRRNTLFASFHCRAKQEKSDPLVLSKDRAGYGIPGYMGLAQARADAINASRRANVGAL